jgi:hypothetical protein
VQDEVAVEGGHYGLEEGAQGGGAGKAFAGRLQENGVWGIKLQDGFQLFGAKVLDPGFADFRKSCDSRGLRLGGGGWGKIRCADGGTGQERYGSAARAGE